MEALGAIVFLPRDERDSSLFLDDILFDPAALWLSETLRREGVERFLVVCSGDLRAAAAPCFPAGVSFADSEAADFITRVTDFLTQVPGPVVVVTHPILLAPAGTGFARSGKEPPKRLFTLRGAALAAALQDGRGVDETLSSLGDTRPWQGRFLPLTEDLVFRATQMEPLARSLGVERMLASGVRVVDTESTFVGPAVTAEAGAVLLPGTILRGRTVVGAGCVIGPNSMVRDCQLGARVTVNSSQLNESVVDDDATVGPFAYIRPHCHVGKAVKVGDFVELKNSTVGDGTKISHLTYVGDTDAGAHINFGCGTVTVNYDGKKKFRTTIGNGAFIGCNTNLVAPVTVGAGAYTAAGSTITDEVPDDALGIARARQVNKDGWAARRNQAD